MKIGFDARLIEETGVGRYIKNLLEELKRIDTVNEYFIFLSESAFKHFDIPNNRWHKILTELDWHSFKEQIMMPRLLKKFKLDFVHFPYFNVPFFYKGNFVTTVHDLIIDHYPTGRASTLPYFFYYLKRLMYYLIMNNSLKKAKIIFAISNTTKNEVIDHYSIDPDKIKVTYDSLESSLVKIKKKYKPVRLIEPEYLLYVGNAYPHKNLERLCLCFNDPELNSQVKLVLSGDDWFFYPRLKNFVVRNGLQNKIIFTDFADDRKLHNLYSFARGLVIPSLMEGFGLPNLEAVYFGLMPVVSDIPVFREIWEDDLLYFNPKNQKDIKSKLLLFLKLKNSERKARLEKARLKIRNYSWKKTAEVTLSNYRQMMLK